MIELPWEDNLLERKLQSDLKDLLKTIVAFANSVKPGHIATILIGEKDDGTMQGVENADNIQKNIRTTCDKIYPPILWSSKVYEKDHKICVRVDIEYDGETPHFGGISWVRKGSETIAASDEIFQRLIEYRISKVREIAKWIDKKITLTPETGQMHELDFSGSRKIRVHPRISFKCENAILQSVNNFWVTFEYQKERRSEPLDKVVLNWDNKNDQLELLIKI